MSHIIAYYELKTEQLKQLLADKREAESLQNKLTQESLGHFNYQEQKDHRTYTATIQDKQKQIEKIIDEL